MTIPNVNYFPFLAGEETMDKLAKRIRAKMEDYLESSKLQSLRLCCSLCAKMPAFR